MDKERSIGVTIFVWWGIFIVMPCLLIFPSKINLYSILYFFVVILLNYNLFKLKNWSRIMLLIISWIYILLFFAVLLAIIWLIQMNAKIQNISFIASLKMIYPLNKQMQIWKLASPYLPILAPVLFMITLAYFCSFILFFNHPKVKEQFRKNKLPQN